MEVSEIMISPGEISFIYSHPERRIFLLILLLSFACNGRMKEPVCIAQLQSIEVPQQELIITHAQRFTLERENSYTKLTVINPWQGADGINHVWYFVRRENEIPSGVDPANVILVPVKNIICMSTTHLAMISALEEEETIYAVSGAAYVYDKKLTGKVKNSEIPDVGYEASLNKELIISISPDLIMMYGIGNESAGYISKIRELGFHTVFNADYLEIDPLGKAEWIKLFGALYCKEQMADSIFRSLSQDYFLIKDLIQKNIKERPKVMLGLPYKDTWFISPGNSYISKIISDAGGDYLWKDTESSVSMPFGIENVYTKALTADYWLNTGSAQNMNEILAVDPRLAALPCFKNGNLFNNNNRINKNGGNDYWESGSLYPNLILKDIASILHPGLFGNAGMYYYCKLK